MKYHSLVLLPLLKCVLGMESPSEVDLYLGPLGVC